MDKVVIKLAELKKMTGNDRARLLGKLHEQLRALRFEIKSSQSQAVRRVRQIKRSIARIMTVQSSLTLAGKIKAQVTAKSKLIKS